MRQIMITLLLIFLSVPTLAHDGSDHTSELEMWVAGIGIILIFLACIYSFWWSRFDSDDIVEYDSFEGISDRDIKN